MKILEGFIKCPHCYGMTHCRCSTCGKQIENPGKKWEKGICQVCKGIGQLPIPKQT